MSQHVLCPPTTLYSNPFRFGGQFGYCTAPKTSLVLLGHRYYDPGTGRFLNRDPSSYSGGVNLYGYADDNPVNEEDSSGFGYEPINEALDAGSVIFDGSKLVYDHFHGASALEVSVDSTALGLDGLALLPGVPPAMGRVYALAHGGMVAAHSLEALRTAQIAAKGAQGIMMAADSENETASSNGGRTGKQTRLRQLLNDPKVSSSDRGWIQQEINSIRRGQRRSIRNPIGKILAHRRGMRAKNGNSYLNSDLQDIDLHKLEHKYEGY